MTDAAWSPVVLARLFRVDEWWREVPEGTRADGWLGDAVSAAVMNGRGLSGGPRMLLARPPGRYGGAPPVLVGVACDAERISAAFRTDSGGRPLYCFVGWLSAPGAADIPSLEALHRGFPRWAKETYERAVGPDWESTTSPEWRGYSAPGPAPWGPADLAGGDGPPTALPRPEGRGVWLLPEGRAGAYWGGARTADGPCVLVTGWSEPHAPTRSALTHLCGTGFAAPAFDGERSYAEGYEAPAAEGEDSGAYNSWKKYATWQASESSQALAGVRGRMECVSRKVRGLRETVLGGRRSRETRTGSGEPAPPLALSPPDTSPSPPSPPDTSAAGSDAPVRRAPLKPGSLPGRSVVSREEFAAGGPFASLGEPARQQEDDPGTEEDTT